MWRVLAVAAILSLAVGETSARAAVPRIAYDAGGDIHIIGSDGTGADNLTDGLSGSARHPEWSPDGKRIMFIKDFDVWMMDPDGTNAERVVDATDPQAIIGAAWSPDGARIALARYTLLSGNQGSIVTSRPDGTDVQPVVAELAHDGWISWSRNGLLVYMHEFGSTPGTRTVPATGGSPTVIFPSDGLRAYQPRWSPSGSEIAFLGCDVSQGCNNDIWTADADGGNPVQLTDYSGADITPSWSADGTRIAWSRQLSQEEGFRLHVMDADGSNEALLPNAAAGVSASSWEPLPDEDGDGLPDAWEKNGVDTDGNGEVDLNLPAMGADPRHKDIYVEIDPMSGHFPPTLTFFDRVVEAFANAPLTNPDGEDGIDLHIDFGSNTPMDPNDSEDTWGTFTRANEILHADFTGSTSASGYSWGAFDLIKQLNFDTAREKVFHYALFAHALGGFSVGGLSRNSATGPFHASDFILTIQHGYFTDTERNERVVGGAFMHELGHNLGLRHGGFENDNFKPTYLSVMNYAFQEGLVKEDGGRVLDFSRSDLLLDETFLLEPTGIGATGDPATFHTLTRCPDGTRVRIAMRATPTDWDCDGELDPHGLAIDTNGNNVKVAERGHLDWEHIVFAGGSIGAAGAPALPEETPVNEPDFAETRALSELLEGPLLPAPVPVGPGSGGGPGPGPPVLSALRVKAAGKRPRITYVLSAAAEVAFRVQRRKGGHWRAVRKGRFSHVGAAGANALRMPRALAKRLRQGRHRLTATPAGGAPVRATFKRRR